MVHESHDGQGSALSIGPSLISTLQVIVQHLDVQSCFFPASCSLSAALAPPTRQCNMTTITTLHQLSPPICRIHKDRYVYVTCGGLHKKAHALKHPSHVNDIIPLLLSLLTLSLSLSHSPLFTVNCPHLQQQVAFSPIEFLHLL